MLTKEELTTKGGGGSTGISAEIQKVVGSPRAQAH